MERDKKLEFFAVLTPNRSLTPKGFVVFMTITGVVSLVFGIFFAVLGAWPIFGFFGLDVVLLYWAFKRNFADSAVCETVHVTDRELVVQKTWPKRPMGEHRFNRHWVRLDLVEDKARELIGSLTINSHGRSTEIASFLGQDERKQLHKALQKALGFAGINR